MMEPGEEWIAFEQPLSERIRSFLRLEFLFAQHAHYRNESSVWAVRGSVHSLLDVLSVMGRTDFRTELVKDFTEQRILLTRLKARPGVDRERLDGVLRELEETAAMLQALTVSNPAAVLRENEFLFSMLNRVSIPGGATDFDLPAYHRWLSRPHASVERDIEGWFVQLRPFERAIGLHLRLLRESTKPTDETADNGIYLHHPHAAYQMVRVLVPPSADVYPEISAGKHRVSVRFMRLGDVNTRNTQAAGHINFRLQCCLLSSH